MPLPVPAADDPISWRLLLAIGERLERLRVANGALTDIGADVRLDAGQIDLMGLSAPATWLWADDFNAGEGGTGRLVRTQMQITAVALIPGDSIDHMRLAHRARLDLRRAFADLGEGLPTTANGGNVNVTVGNTLIEQRPDGSPCIAVQLTAQAGLAESIRAP
jgi:hypothetical protein